jgi:HAD superfamily hydrolase (TIGR01484 family)
MTISEKDRTRLAGIRILFADIDDTISTSGKIETQAYAAMWRARNEGLDVVPVTGRPAGWCDHIARMWPVSAVIGENGGLYFRMVPGGMEKVYMHDAETRADFRARLQNIREEILHSVPGSAIASDQQYREYDLAIDYCEDVPPLADADVEQIVSIFRKHGANAKISSIHVNGWFGDFDKLTMVRRFAGEAYGLDLNTQKESSTFVGDSPNDEPLFGFFPLSFGVANVARFLESMDNPPAFVTEERCGAGFAELVNTVLSARQSQHSNPGR